MTSPVITILYSDRPREVIDKLTKMFDFELIRRESNGRVLLIAGRVPENWVNSLEEFGQRHNMAVIPITEEDAEKIEKKS